MVFRRREELGTTKQLKKRVAKKRSRPTATSRRDEAKRPAIPAAAPPSVPNPPIGPPVDFVSQYTAGLVAFNALPEIVSRVSNPFLQFLVNRGPQSVQRSLLRTLGPQLGKGAGRFVINRAAPLLMLAGLGPQPQPGRYGIPQLGTLDFRRQRGMADPAAFERLTGLSEQFISLPARRLRRTIVRRR